MIPASPSFRDSKNGGKLMRIEILKNALKQNEQVRTAAASSK